MGLIAHTYLCKGIFHHHTGKEKSGVCLYKHHVLTVIASLRNLTSMNQMMQVLEHDNYKQNSQHRKIILIEHAIPPFHL